MPGCRVVSQRKWCFRGLERNEDVCLCELAEGMSDGSSVCLVCAVTERQKVGDDAGSPGRGGNGGDGGPGTGI